MPLLHRFRKRLLTHVLAMNVLLAIGCMVITGTFFIFAMRGVLLDHVQLQVEEMGKAFATRVQFPLLVGDKDELKSIASEFLKIQDVLFVEITDRNETSIILTKAPFSAGQIPDDETLNSIRN